MFSLHPVILIISLVSVFCYSVLLNGVRALKFNLAVMLPVALIVTLVNPLFNHAGNTVLFYFNGSPVTLESAVFGLTYALVFITVIIAFSCSNRVMTSDKLMYLFSRLTPVLSLMFSMTLRFVPRYKVQIRKITAAQKGIGMDPSHGNVFCRVKNGVRILSIFITWALENAVESADSMKARGFGLKGRTSFSIYSWKRKDRILLAAELVLFGISVSGFACGKFASEYIPMIHIAGLDVKTLPFYFAYALFCFLPIIVDCKEVEAWNRSKSAG